MNSDLFQIGMNPVRRDAEISPCGRYRYWLKRWWDDDPQRPWTCWVMLNPSTADAAADDPTIRRCVGFSRAWGMGGMFVVNVFAYRATDPIELLTADDPYGPENDHWLSACLKETLHAGGPVVAAWGSNSMIRSFPGRVARAADLLGCDLMCLGKTQQGFPRHPLYMPKAAELSLYRKFRRVEGGAA